jgi:hypothetical protein
MLTLRILLALDDSAVCVERLSSELERLRVLSEIVSVPEGLPTADFASAERIVGRPFNVVLITEARGHRERITATLIDEQIVVLGSGGADIRAQYARSRRLDYLDASERNVEARIAMVVGREHLAGRITALDSRIFPRAGDDQDSEPRSRTVDLAELRFLRATQEDVLGGRHEPPYVEDFRRRLRETHAFEGTHTVTEEECTLGVNLNFDLPKSREVRQPRVVHPSVLEIYKRECGRWLVWLKSLVSRHSKVRVGLRLNLPAYICQASVLGMMEGTSFVDLEGSSPYVVLPCFDGGVPIDEPVLVRLVWRELTAATMWVLRPDLLEEAIAGKLASHWWWLFKSLADFSVAASGADAPHTPSFSNARSCGPGGDAASSLAFLVYLNATSSTLPMGIWSDARDESFWADVQRVNGRNLFFEYCLSVFDFAAGGGSVSVLAPCPAFLVHDGRNIADAQVVTHDEWRCELSGMRWLLVEIVVPHRFIAVKIKADPKTISVALAARIGDRNGTQLLHFARIDDGFLRTLPSMPGQKIWLCVVRSPNTPAEFFAADIVNMSLAANDLPKQPSSP